MKYKVREGFVVHDLEGGPFEGGTELDLDAEQAERYAVQVELADPAEIKKAEKAEADASKAAAAAAAAA
jgi:hypothetical protein